MVYFSRKEDSFGSETAKHYEHGFYNFMIHTKKIICVSIFELSGLGLVICHELVDSLKNIRNLFIKGSSVFTLSVLEF